MNRPSRHGALAALALALSLSVVACGDDADDDDAAPAPQAAVTAPSTPVDDDQLDDQLDDQSDAPPASAPVDDDAPLTGDTLQRAAQAALAEVDDGQVTDSSRSDDADHVYEVEVTLPDGQDVDVELDGDFRVIQVDR